MTFDGTVAEVNAALAGLSFNPTTGFTGAASLQIVTSDQGNTGSGGTLTDNDTVTITVVLDLGIFTANQDIGGPGTAGSSSHSAGTYTVAGGGSDIWNNADQFQFLSMPMTGDGRLTAKVVSQTQTPTTSNPAKAGVMFRETLSAGSIHGMVDLMKANGSSSTGGSPRTDHRGPPLSRPASRHPTGCGSPGSATSSRASARRMASLGPNKGQPSRSR